MPKTFPFSFETSRRRFPCDTSFKVSSQYFSATSNSSGGRKPTEAPLPTESCKRPINCERNGFACCSDNCSIFIETYAGGESVRPCARCFQETDTPFVAP